MSIRNCGGITQCARRRLHRVRPNIPRCWNAQKGAPVGRTTQGRYGTVKPHEVAPMSEVVLTIIGVVDKTGGVPALRALILPAEAEAAA